MDYIDYDVAIKYTYSKEILEKVVKRFLLEYNSFDLKIMHSSNEEVKSLIHKIKGITLNLGATKLYYKCLQIEETNNFTEDIKSFVYIFNKTYKELLNL